VEDVLGVPRAGGREAFGAGPEGLSVFGNVLLGEESLQVTDSVVVVTIEFVTC